MKKYMLIIFLIFGCKYMVFGQQLPEALVYFGFPTVDGITDFGIMSETAARQKIEQEFNEFLIKALNSTNDRFTYGIFYDGIEFALEQNQINELIQRIERYQQPQQYRLYKVWTTRYYQQANRYGDTEVFYIWFGNNTIAYLLFNIIDYQR